MAKWADSEIEVLQNLYRENDVPSDQLIKDQQALGPFVATFNERVGS